MTQEDIIKMRDKNCPDYLCGSRDESYYLRKIAKLEAEIKQLQNTSSNSDYAKCPECGGDMTCLIKHCPICLHEWQ